MKIRKLLFSALCMLALGTAFTACSDNDDPNNDFHDEGSKVTLPHHRAFILNEGTMGANNANISLYAPNKDCDFINDLFFQQNNARLGDTGQSMIEYNDYLYVIVANSKYIARLNTAGVELDRHAFSESEGDPRYMAAEDGYIYLTQYGGKVSKLDAETLDVVATFEGGSNLEGIAECNGKLYVANSYSKTDAGYQYHNEVFVINPQTMQLEKTLTVTVNPNQLVEENDKVFLISFGDYGAVGYTAQMIDPSNNDAVTVLATATSMTAGNGNVYFVNSETDYSHWSETSTTNTFFSYNIATSTLNQTSFLKDAPAELATSSIYSMDVDDEDGNIYIGVTFYSNSNGTIYRFQQDGTFVEKFDCGGQNPKKMVFVD